MNRQIIILCLFAFICIASVALVKILIADQKKRQRDAKKDILNKEIPKQRQILTNREHAMYDVLRKGLNEYVIFVQVGFAALLSAKNKAVLNTFLQKRADFVICNQSLDVIAVLELDDKSHNQREEADLNRDKLLTNAGYVVVHYKEIPSPEGIFKDIHSIEEKMHQPHFAKDNQEIFSKD